jgi:HemY protein
LVESVEAARLSAARWALSDRDAQGALNWLASLPQGVARRTLTLRLRLKATRLMQNNLSALETARLLAKHGAFSDVASQSLLRSLSLACLAECHDRAQFQTAWLALDRDEQEDPEVALQATQRWLSLQGDPRDALQWLLPLWNQWVLSEAYRSRLADVMEQAFLALPPDTEWLGRIDQARQHLPRHLELQYLSGRVCMRHGLWGKAQQVLERAAPLLTGSILQRRAWSALAELAEQRGDAERAAQAWKKAAQS